MDTNLTVNDLRMLITVVSFIVFAGIVYWAYSGRQRQSFEEAANLPFADEDLPAESPLRTDEERKGKGVRP